MRDDLVLSWKESGRLGPARSTWPPTGIALYFGSGGTYDADGLEDGADMLERGARGRGP